MLEALPLNWGLFTFWSEILILLTWVCLLFGAVNESLYDKVSESKLLICIYLIFLEILSFLELSYFFWFHDMFELGYLVYFP